MASQVSGPFHGPYGPVSPVPLIRVMANLRCKHYDNYQQLKYMFNKNSKTTAVVNNGYSTGQQSVVLNVGNNGYGMPFAVQQMVDSDVLAEKQRIDGLVGADSVTSDAIVVRNLCKTFKAFPAVNNLSFGVHKEECFGLLGVNGAGKTATFCMLTGDEILAEGQTWIGRLSHRQDITSAHIWLGIRTDVTLDGRVRSPMRSDGYYGQQN